MSKNDRLISIDILRILRTIGACHCKQIMNNSGACHCKQGGVVTDYLGKISLLYYLTHGVTIYLISKYAKINNESILIMSVIIGNFVLSNIIMFFYDFIFGFTKRHTDKVATIRFK